MARMVPTLGRRGWCRARVTAAPLAALLLMSAVASPAVAAPAIHFGQGDSIAIDQPRVSFEMFNTTTGQPDGPQWPLPALLDTGANGVVLTQLAYLDFEHPEFINPDLYERAQRTDGSFVQYAELGVGGFELFDVTAAYELRIQGLSSTPQVHTVDAVRALGKHDLSIASLPAIVGMPAMVDRRTTLDLTTLINPDPDVYLGIPYIDVGLEDLPADPDLDAAPGSAAHRFHVPFDMWLPPHSDPEEPGDPAPTFAPMPFVDNVTLHRGSEQISRRMLVDTGAQLSIISTNTALALGIDPVADAEDYIEIGGIGDIIEAPLVSLDRLILPTNQGPGLAIDGLYVAIIDIGEDIVDLDGIIGMNILSSGYATAIIELLGDLGDLWPGEPVEGIDIERPGMFRRVHFEFAGWDDDATGRMVLDLNPAYDGLDAILGDMNLDGIVDAVDVAQFVLALTDPEAYVQQHGAPPDLLGDVNRDGSFDAADVAPFVERLVTGAASVPEPGSAALLAATACLLLRRRR
ncbi:MAG: aspartyl protease family protein [Phycisphaeraceae bacterium]